MLHLPERLDEAAAPAADAAGGAAARGGRRTREAPRRPRPPRAPADRRQDPGRLERHGRSPASRWPASCSASRLLVERAARGGGLHPRRDAPGRAARCSTPGGRGRGRSPPIWRTTPSWCAACSPSTTPPARSAGCDAAARAHRASRSARLRDPQGGFFVAAASPDLLFRSKDVFDGAMPAANAVAVLNLLDLGGAHGRPRLAGRGPRPPSGLRGDHPDPPRRRADADARRPALPRDGRRPRGGERRYGEERAARERDAEAGSGAKLEHEAERLVTAASRISER